MTKPLDRSEAVNLARNALEFSECPALTTKGQLCLAEAVMKMDAELTRLYALSPEGAPSLPPDMAILERCREICMRVSFEAEEAAKAKDATDYAAGYRDACVDIDEEIRALTSSKPQLGESK